MKTKIVILAVAVMAMWGLKRHYADARAEDLVWILSPTARLVGAVTGDSFVLEPGEGYLSRDRMFVIEKSCAGINFMIAAFGMSAFALRRRVQSVASGATVLAASLTAAYAAAVLVNAVRITIAMWLTVHPTGIDAHHLHRLEGIVVYFGGLAFLYHVVQRFDRQATCHRAAAPLVWYYAITLAIPLLNGAGQQGGRFVQHAMIVLAVPPVLIVLARVARDAARFVPIRIREHRE